MQKALTRTERNRISSSPLLAREWGYADSHPVGLRALAVDAAPSVGGTRYHNRYPGARALTSKA